MMLLLLFGGATAVMFILTLLGHKEPLPDIFKISFIVPFCACVLALFVTNSRATTEACWRSMMMTALLTTWIAIPEGPLAGGMALAWASASLYLLRYTVIKTKVIAYTKADYDKAFSKMTPQ